MRPVLIVQTDWANSRSPITIIVPFTTRIRTKMLPSHVLVPAGEGGLNQDSVILAEQVRVVDGTPLIKKLGALPDARMQETNDALRAILDL